MKTLQSSFFVLIMILAALKCVSQGQSGGPEAVQGDLDSLTLEARVGKELAARVNAHMLQVTDPIVIEYVQHLADKLSSSCEPEHAIPVRIVGRRTVDAIALPGFLYIHENLIIGADGEAELAGLLAHEIAHICTHQFIRNTSRDATEQLVKPTLTSWPCMSPCVPDFVAPPLTTRFPPEMEMEADNVAIKMLEKNGYDASALRSILLRLARRYKQMPESFDSDFASHLPTAVRLRNMRRQLAAERKDSAYILDTSEFAMIKDRLLAIQKRRTRQIHIEALPSASRGVSADFLPIKSKGSAERCLC